MPWRLEFLRADRPGGAPPWAFKLAFAAAAVVMLAVLAVVIFPAAVAFAIVLLVGVAWSRIRRALARILPDRSGRRNVRVIARRDQP